MLKRHRFLTLGIAVIGCCLGIQGAYLTVASLPAFRALLKAELERGGAGSFSFGRIDGSPFNVRLRDFVFLSRGASNIKKIRSPTVHATLQWWPSFKNRRVILETATLEDAEIEARLDGGRPIQIAFPLDVETVHLRRSVVKASNVSGWRLFLGATEADLVQQGYGESLTISGQLRCQRAMLAHLQAQDVDVQLRVVTGRLEFTALKARLYGGVIQMEGAIRLEPAQSFRLTTLGVAGIDVASALQALGLSNRFAGRATIEGRAEGQFTPTVQDLSGQGRLRLTAFSARADLPRNLFNIAPVLKELKDVDGLSGGAEARFSGARIQLDEFVLEKRGLKVTGSGHVALDRTVAMDCRGVLGEQLARGVPGVVRSSLARDDTGDLLVPFRIGNTLSEPRVEVGTVVRSTLLGRLKKVF